MLTQLEVDALMRVVWSVIADETKSAEVSVEKRFAEFELRAEVLEAREPQTGAPGKDGAHGTPGADGQKGDRGEPGEKGDSIDVEALVAAFVKRFEAG